MARAALTGDDVALLGAVADWALARSATHAPQQYGAVGDGATDDTAALQAWLDDPDKLKILPGGEYRVTAALTCTVDGVTIVGPGVLKCGAAELILLTVSGDDTTVDGLRIDGWNLARYGIRATGNGHTIQRCTVENIRSTTSTARAIDSSTRGRVIIRDNVIRNVEAVGDTTGGDANGLCRGIVLHADANKTAPALCTGNWIDNIHGEEADAIAVLYSDAVTDTDAYQHGWTKVAGNTIRNVGRRHIKVQGSDVWVDGNWCYNDPGFVQRNPSSVIDIIQGHRVRITNNWVQEAGNTAPVSITGPSSTGRIVDVEVSGNRLSEGDNASPVVYFVHVDGLTVKDNVLTGGTFYVSGGAADVLVVSGNDCRGGVTGNAAFGFTASVFGKVRYNTVPTGRPVGAARNVSFTGND